MIAPVQLSVIIPTLNEAAALADCVASAWGAGADEVLVADGGSTDGTRDLARRLDCRLVAAERGRAVQQNAGARESAGDVLLFLHADNRLSAGCGAQVRRELGEGGAVCGAFRQRIEAAGLGFRLLERGNAARVRWLGLPYGDQAIVVRREVFERLRGFPSVPLLEDLLLMRRLRCEGWPRLLPGPLYVSPRRWQRYGIVRQTLCNWWLLAAHRLGRSPAELAAHYRRHDDVTRSG